MRLFLIPLYFTVLFVADLNAGQTTATVTVIAEDSEGHRLEGARIEMKQYGTNITHRADLRNGKLKHVPSGYYELTAFVPGFDRYSRPLAVGEAGKVTIRAPMVISTEYSGAFPLRGMVRDVGSCNDRTWLLFLPLMAGPDHEIDALLDSACRFSVSVRIGGQYLLVVLRGSSVAYTQQMYIAPQSKDLVIGKP